MKRVIILKKRAFILERSCIFGDSTSKHINSYEISSQIKYYKVYDKGFPSAKTQCMKDYAPATTRENSDRIVIQVGTKDLPTKKQPDVIAEVLLN